MCDSLPPMRDALSLSQFRRRVADNYARARAAGAGAEAWTAWRADRDALFASHPQSPVPAGARAAFRAMGFFPYDLSWRLTAVVEPISTDAPGASPAPGAPSSGVSSRDGEFRFVGTAVAMRGGDEIRLPLHWLDA
ncbi:MAG: hypothetical protein FJW78_01060, partial [Actinobacteria bacterium]|nr:hypothetical protein [Actinomycetota bacterium]